MDSDKFCKEIAKAISVAFYIRGGTEEIEQCLLKFVKAIKEEMTEDFLEELKNPKYLKK